jgi:hypothetical protein
MEIPPRSNVFCSVRKGKIPIPSMYNNPDQFWKIITGNPITNQE